MKLGSDFTNRIDNSLIHIVAGYDLYVEDEPTHVIPVHYTIKNRLFWDCYNGIYLTRFKKFSSLIHPI